MVPTEKGMHKKIVKTYEISLRNFLLTARFNTITWSENVRYRSENPTIQSIYGSPTPLSKHIPADAVIFMLEMNNDLNRIMGIGLVRNHPVTNKYFVHESGDYNRYIYTGKHRIDRETMSEEEEKVMQIFDVLCFTSKRHMKRCHGLKSFPAKFLVNCKSVMDITSFLENMFVTRFSSSSKST